MKLSYSGTGKLENVIKNHKFQILEMKRGGWEEKKICNRK